MVPPHRKPPKPTFRGLFRRTVRASLDFRGLFRVAIATMSAQTAQWVMLGTRCRGPSLVCARCLYNPPRPPSVSSRSISTPTSEEQSADPAGSRSWTRRARSGTPGGKWCMPLRSATSSSSVFRGYRFAANSVMPETNEVSSISRRAHITRRRVLRSSSPISNLQSRGGGVSGGGSTSFQGDALFLSHLQADLHPLFAPFCNLQCYTILEAPLARKSTHLRLRPEISRCRWRQLKISIFS